MGGNSEVNESILNSINNLWLAGQPRPSLAKRSLAKPGEATLDEAKP